MINAKSSGEGMEQTMEGCVFDKYEYSSFDGSRLRRFTLL